MEIVAGVLGLVACAMWLGRSSRHKVELLEAKRKAWIAGYEARMQVAHGRGIDISQLPLGVTPREVALLEEFAVGDDQVRLN